MRPSCPHLAAEKFAVPSVMGAAFGYLFCDGGVIIVAEHDGDFGGGIWRFCPHPHSKAREIRRCTRAGRRFWYTWTSPPPGTR